MSFFGNIAGGTYKPIARQGATEQDLQAWWDKLLAEGQQRKISASRAKPLSAAELEVLARETFESIKQQALDSGVNIPEEFLTRLVGELSGLGPILELISRSGVEDIAINLGHIYVYTTSQGWEYYGPAPAGLGDAVRVMIDRNGQRPPTPDYPIADAMLQVVVPSPSGGVVRKGLRVNFIMPPASPYGDVITLRVSNYRTADDLKNGNLSSLCVGRLPPIERPSFSPKEYPRTDRGLLTPEAANYLLAVMVHGGTLIISGTTGSGKTYVAQRILQEMLDFYPRGAIRLFIIEDSNEIVLNGWNGDPNADTGNIVYTVTRPEIRGGPPPVTMYDLIRAALRSRPHGVVVGEARGAEAWELIRAAATGHGYSAFTIHATGAEHVWSRFIQVVQSHPDVQKLNDFQIAQSFAEAVTAVMHIERSPIYGQIVREIAEVSPIVERAASRPSFNPLFRFDTQSRVLVPTGNRPMRMGFQAANLGIPETYFVSRR